MHGQALFDEGRLSLEVAHGPHQLTGVLIGEAHDSELQLLKLLGFDIGLVCAGNQSPQRIAAGHRNDNDQRCGNPRGGCRWHHANRQGQTEELLDHVPQSNCPSRRVLFIVEFVETASHGRALARHGEL